MPGVRGLSLSGSTVTGRVQLCGLRPKRQRLACAIILLALFLLVICLHEESVAISSKETLILFLAPKPGLRTHFPKNLFLWQAELNSINGRVVLLLNEADDIEVSKDFGFDTLSVQETESGLPLLSSILEVASTFTTSSLVGFLNSDLLPGKDFAATILAVLDIKLPQHRILTLDNNLQIKPLARHRPGWLLVGSRIDYMDTPSDGHIFTEGGVDMWIWNNIENSNTILGINVEIPPFCLGRPWFDNWLTATAIQLGGRHVIDSTQELHFLHRIHRRIHNLSNWEDMSLLANDADWVRNRDMASTKICSTEGHCAEYRLGIGTTCEAPYILARNSLFWGRGIKVVARKKHIPCPACPGCY